MAVAQRGSPYLHMRLLCYLQDEVVTNCARGGQVLAHCLATMPYEEAKVRSLGICDQRYRTIWNYGYNDRSVIILLPDKMCIDLELLSLVPGSDPARPGHHQ